MTDPKTRNPAFWRTFAWMFASVAVLSLAGGIALVVLGTATGWVNIALGVIFAFQSIGYYRLFRRSRREREFGAGRE